MSDLMLLKLKDKAICITGCGELGSNCAVTLAQDSIVASMQANLALEILLNEN